MKGITFFPLFELKFKLSGSASSKPKPNRRLVSSVVRTPVCCVGGRWFEPQTGPTLRVLK